MNRMEAIRDEEQEAELIRRLGNRDSKYKILWLLGRETGFRISDLLSLRVKDVKNKKTVKEAKTGKWRDLKISDELKKQINRYIRQKGLKGSDYLIPSRDGEAKKALSRKRAWSVISSEAREMGLEGVGTHSMRKTYAGKLYEQTGAIWCVQEALQHKYMGTTLAYLVGKGQKLVIVDE